MSIRKKIILSASILVTILTAFVIGFCIQPMLNKDKTIPVVSSPDKTPIVGGWKEPVTCSYNASNITINRDAEDIINFSYQPDINVGEAVTQPGATAVAYEYRFGNISDETIAINLNNIKSDDVNIWYYSSENRLTDSTEFEATDLYKAPTIDKDGKDVYIYILVEPKNNSIPADFSTSIKWAYGKKAIVKLYDNVSGEFKEQVIVKGQDLEEGVLHQPIVSNSYQFEGWYLDQDYTQKVDYPYVTEGRELYAKIPNLPTDWLDWDSTKNCYYVKRGNDTADLPSNLVIPSTYTTTNHGTADVEYIWGGGSTRTDGVFYGCNNLNRVIIPDTLTEIGNFSFSECAELVHVNISKDSNLSRIGSFAFLWCSRMLGIVIPESIEEIGYEAFNECYALAEIYNLSSLPLECESYAHGYVARYAKVVYDTLNVNSRVVEKDGMVYYKANEANYIALYVKDRAISSVTLDSQTIRINRNAFNSCANLINIDIPANVLSIGGKAFSNCTALQSVTIPYSVVELENYVFYNCSNLTTVNFAPNSHLQIIGKYVFEDCVKLNNITLPSTVNWIDSKAFTNNQALTNITIPANVEYFGNYIFYDCINLESITFEEGSKLANLGDQCFYNCVKLTTFTVPSNVTSIGVDTNIDDTFGNCTALKTLKFADNSKLQTIKTNLGLETTNIRNIEFGDNSQITSIANLISGLGTLNTLKFGDGCKLTSLSLSLNNNFVNTISFGNDCDLTSINVSGCKNNLKTLTFGDNCKITTISAGMGFAGNTKLTTLTFGNNSKLTSIGQGAFKGCTALNTLSFGENSILDSIGVEGLYNTAIANITLPSTLTSIGGKAFTSCLKLKSITIPARVNSLGNYAFYNCHALNSVVFEEGSQITNFGVQLFYDCYNLKSLEIPARVTTFASNTFENSSFTSIKFADNSQLTTLDSAVGLSGCSSTLTSLTFGANAQLSSISNNLFTNFAIQDLSFGDNCKLTTLSYSWGLNSSLRNLSFGDNCKLSRIAGGSFNSCANLTNVSFGDYCLLPGLSGGAGWANTKIETISVGEYSQMTNISQEAFRGITTLKSVTFGANQPNFKSIWRYAFENCTNLTTVTIPSGTVRIEGAAFTRCTSLESISIPASVEYFGNYVFKESGIKTITFEEGSQLNSLGTQAFGYCASLQAVQIPNTITDTSLDQTFEGCTSLTSVNIPSSVTSLYRTFHGCTSLPSITIPNGVTSLSETFYNCNALLEIAIPNTVTSIWGQTFAETNVLTTITFEQGTRLEYFDWYYAFKNCANLTSIDLSCVDTTAEYGQISDYDVDTFYGCGNLVSVVLPEGLNKICDNMFYNCAKITTVNIPSSATSLGVSAFYGCSSLPSIVLPEGITTIPETAFYKCGKLESITIPSTVKIIEKTAFAHDVKLSNVIFNGTSQLTTINSQAFYNTTGLKNISLPASLKTIGVKAFYNTGIVNLTIPANVTTIPESAFDSSASLQTVTFASGSVCSKIDKQAFYHCTALKSFTVPSNVQSLGGKVFAGCTEMTSFTFAGNKITAIGNYALHGCSKLESIIIPTSVITIGNYCFQNCTNLDSISFADADTWYYSTSTTESSFTNTISVATASTNATNFKGDYVKYYWRKK